MGYSLLVSPDTSTTLSNQTYRHAIIESVCGFARYVVKVVYGIPSNSAMALSLGNYSIYSIYSPNL